MGKLHRALALGAAVLLAACVTINVYFPAAEAEKAAQQFIDQVIGADAGAEQTPQKQDAPTEQPGGMAVLFNPIATAHAQADLQVETPAIRAIQQRMAERFKSQLAPFFASGAIGLTRQGLVEVRDLAAVGLGARAALKTAVTEENQDRSAVYREIAVANQHPEWEAEIRATFAKQWVEKAPKGWYYHDDESQWRQK